MSDNTVLSQVLSEQVSKMQKSLDEFSRVCSNAIDVYTQSNEDLISREAVLDLSYWHGERETYDNPMPDGVEAVDVEDIIKLPSRAKLTHEPTAGDCWGCNCPKMNTEPKITFETLQDACKYRRIYSIRGKYRVDCFYEGEVNECKNGKCPLLNQRNTEEL